jgi:penicillin-binding protein 1C
MPGQRNRKHPFLRRKRIVFFATLSLMLLLTVRFLTILPEQLFVTPYSTVVEDDEGDLLAAIIADDGQWRFPADTYVPVRFMACITEFEDAFFFFHHGVDATALVKAAVRNIREGRIVSGGSTITMQVIRLSRMAKPRTFREKIKEMIMALRLELSHSKSEILTMYAAHAPFGGNVVGLEAAAWRYYGIEPEQLSWGQAATLAVLPNAPSLIYPGKNDTLLLNKRNRLLKKLFDKNYFSRDVYELAIAEPLPGKPYPLPSDGVHILNRVLGDKMKGQRVRTTIRKDVQQFVQSMVNKHAGVLSGNKVYNAAALVIEVESGNIIAYVGNSTDSREHNNLVDMINSERSPGSTLKPLLYCAMLNEGVLLPRTIVPDVPMILQGFNPQNYNRSYEGAVPADGALARSLNVPAVHMLKQYGIEKFNFFLKKAGFTTFRQPAHLLRTYLSYLAVLKLNSVNWPVPMLLWHVSCCVIQKAELMMLLMCFSRAILQK